MKSLRFLIVIVMATIFLCENVIAKGQDDRGFGRGRLLKRLRDDLLGSSNPNPANQPRKTPTPAPTKGKVPTPAGNQAGNPYAESQYPNSRQAESRNPATGQRDPRQSSAAKKPSLKSATSLSNPRDFGMTIAANDEKGIVVTRVVPGGNAATAGVRPGDLVIEVGGAELTSMEEFNSIAEVMSQGDQLEFKFQTRGREPRTIQVQYGTTPELEAENGTSALGDGVTRNESGLRSVLDKNSIQANYRSANNRSDQAPLPPQARDTNRRGAVPKLSAEQFKVLQNDQWRSQDRRQAISQQVSGPSLNGPGN